MLDPGKNDMHKKYEVERFICVELKIPETRGNDIMRKTQLQSRAIIVVCFRELITHNFSRNLLGVIKNYISW